jgi:hypothetical protein
VRFDMINESKRIIDTVESCYILPFSTSSRVESCMLWLFIDS